MSSLFCFTVCLLRKKSGLLFSGRDMCLFFFVTSSSKLILGFHYFHVYFLSVLLSALTNRHVITIVLMRCNYREIVEIETRGRNI